MLEPPAISSDFDTVSGRFVMTGAVFTSEKKQKLTIFKVHVTWCTYEFNTKITEIEIKAFKFLFGIDCRIG